MKRFLWMAALAATLSAADIPKFETASIKATPPGADGQSIRLNGSQASFGDYSVKSYIAASSGFSGSRIIGPAWISSAHYDITAKAAKKLEPVESWRMMRTLLEDRFALKSHREYRQVDVLNLTITTRGRLAAPTPGHCFDADQHSPPLPAEKGRPQLFPCGNIVMPLIAGGAELRGGKVHMGMLAAHLTSLIGKPVLDRTGYTDAFDLQLPFTFEGFGHTAPGADASDPNGLPDITSALRSKLGLKLEAGKGPVEFLVIDRIERPTSN